MKHGLAPPIDRRRPRGATLHAAGDGTGISALSAESVLTSLAGEFVIHTVSDTVWDTWAGVEDPAVLSCATGGTGTPIDTFVAGDIITAPFATMLARSTYCEFYTSAPFSSHDVTVEVYADHEGTPLYGSAQRNGVSYATD